MTLTPRQLMAWLEFSDKIGGREQANALAIALMGAQGDPDDVQKTMKRLAGD